MPDPSSTHGPERRRSPRIPGTLLAQVSASLVNGPEVSLVNLSRSGALMEVAARYPMRAFVRLKLVRPPETVTVAAATVVWSRVSSIVNGQVGYLMAVAFEKPIVDIEVATGVRVDGERIPDTTAVEPAAFEIAPRPHASAPAAPEPRPHDEEPTLRLERASATAKVEALQTALDSREQDHRRALREQQERYESIIADMASATNDLRAEICRQRDAADVERRESDTRTRHLEMQLHLLESRGAAHEGRSRLLRQEIERLLAVIATPIEAQPRESLSIEPALAE
jgi:hypothetical protein